MSKHEKLDCPDGIITVGALSIVMRHELEDKDLVHALITYEQLCNAVKSVDPLLKKLDIANMEVADGSRLMLDAKREAEAHDFERAYLTQKMGHNSWRKMLVEHAIATPDDDQIMTKIASLCDERLKTKNAVSGAMARLAIAANRR